MGWVGSLGEGGMRVQGEGRVICYGTLCGRGIRR